MNILQLSTTDVQGGAAKACYRLAKGLRSIGQNCEILVKHKSSDESFVHQMDIHAAEQTAPESFLISDMVQEYYINRQRTTISNTLFSFGSVGYDLSGLSLVQEADIINVHWIIGFQSPQTIAGLLALGKPVIWTLHDQWPFTGGCHYSAGCIKYQSDCAQCPQLVNDVSELASAILKDKVYLFNKPSLTIASPSLWLAECARASSAFHSQRIETIPNSLETDIFSPIDRKTARKNLGIQTEGLILLFGSENGNEKRKGFRELLGAIRTCMDSNEFAIMARNRTVSVMCFGQPAQELDTCGLHIVPLGYLKNDEQLRDAYCAADIFVLPSLEDNLPNTMLESMSCGTPVIAFQAGGMPDVIQHEQTGLLVPYGDTVALGNAILSLAKNPEKRERMGENCRRLMVEKYSLNVQSQKYLQLYTDLMAHTGPAGQSTADRQQPSLDASYSRFDHTPGPALAAKYDKIVSQSFQIRLGECEADRAARLEVIHYLENAITDLRSENNILSDIVHKRLCGNLLLKISISASRNTRLLVRKIKGFVKRVIAQ